MAGQLGQSKALVTGASSGIGEATAKALAREGAAVALVARRQERLEKLAGEIADHGGKPVAIVADITDGEQAGEAVQQAVEVLDGLDIVVNNAGVMLNAPALDATVDEWEQMVELNILGLLYVSHASLPYLVEAAESGPRQVADLVNISSVAGRITRPGSSVYNLTKHGVGAFSDALRKEVTQQRVRVSVIEPGMVETELTDHLRPEVRAAMEERTAGIERMVPEDIADVIEFVVTRPWHVAVNEVLIRPTGQV